MAEVKQEPEVIFEYCVLCSQNFSAERDSPLDEEDVFESVTDCFSIPFPPDIDGAVCPPCRQRLAKAQRLKRFISDTLNKLNNVNSSHSEVGPAEEKSPCGVPPDVGSIKSEPSRQTPVQYHPFIDNDFERDDKNKTLNNLEICRSRKFNRNVFSDDFSSKYHLDLHTAHHSDELNFECDLCSKAFKTKQRLKKHVVVHRDEPKRGSGIRPRTFKRTSRKHTVSDCDERIFKCSVCSKSFKSKELLKHHMSSHMNKTNFKCDVCLKIFKRKRDLESHMNNHGNVTDLKKCSVCFEAFRTRSDLKAHMLIHNDERKFKCSVCSKAFARKNSLNKHMKHHNSERKFECADCSKAFKFKSDLRRHTLIHSSVSDLKCGVCFIAFKTKGDIKVHMITHSDEPNFKCTVCSKAFAIKNSLYKHMKYHSAERNFKCTDCLKAFIFESELRRHMLAHSSVRDWKCSVCSKAFETRLSLGKHKHEHRRKSKFDRRNVCSNAFKVKKSSTGHHGIRNFKCDKEFKLGSDVKAHKNSHTSRNARVSLVRLEYLDSVAARLSDDGLTYILTSADVLLLRSKETKCLKSSGSILKKNRRLKCAVCSELFSSRDALKNHMSVVHTCLMQSDRTLTSRHKQFK